MFYGEPHSVHRYYGEFLRVNTNKVFQKDHKLSPYYVSAWVLHQIEAAMRHGEIKSEWKPYRYHLLYLIQLYVRTCKKMSKLPWFNSKEMDKFAKSILDIANDEKTFGSLLRYLTDVLSEVIKNAPQSWSNYGNNLTRIKDFTTEAETRLIEKMKSL